jgi:hypothetical protein
MTNDELTVYLDSHRDVWPSNAAFLTWLRGAMRKAIWQYHPVKLKYKKSCVQSPPPEYAGRAKGLIKCALTGEWIGQSMAEVDHVVGNASLKGVDDLLPYLLHLAMPQELQCVSKEAHKVKSYAERMGIGFEDALIEKQAIALAKSGGEGWLSSRGLPVPLKKDLRKVLVLELKKERNKSDQI